MGRKRRSRKDLPQRVYFQHGSYYFVSKDAKWNNLGRDYVDAMTAYAKLNSAPVSINNMGALFDRYEREVIPTKAPKTQQGNKRELKLLRHAFAHMRPEHITAQDVYAYMDARAAPVAANREKALLSHVFTKAIRWGIVNDNPCRHVVRNPEKPRRRYVTDVEFKAVYDRAPSAIQCAMRLAIITGLRQGDLLDLKLQNITEDGLLVETGKTGKRLLFEWTEELEQAIEDAKKLPRGVLSMYLLPNRKGIRYKANGFQAVWQGVMRSALADEVLSERFTFHDLRAKAGSDGRDERLLGHEDPKMMRKVYERKPLRVTPTKPNNI
jgi:integrase